MSVPKTLRKDGQLEVFRRISTLVVYTLRIVSNERNFPKKYRWCVTSKIVDTTLEIQTNSNKANSIAVTDESDWKIRRNFQKIALSDTYALLGLIDTAYNTFSLDSEKVSYWTSLVNDCQKYIRKWSDSDRKRYAHINIEASN